jgi:C4-dicarboxylate transporter DctQ subunit
MLRWFDRLDEWLAGVALFACFVVVCFEMAGRSLFNTSFLWSEELSRYLIIVSTYFGAAAAVRTDDHIRVELLIGMLPAALRRAVEVLVSLLCAFFTGVVGYFGYHWVAESAALGLSSADSSLAIPIYVFQAVVPIGFAIMTLRFLARAVRAGCGRPVLIGTHPETVGVQ